DGILPGGRLFYFLPAWKQIAHSAWPILVIETGYQLQFTKFPPPWRVRQMK
ncbi:hypothetical protein K501DRAFT_204398, partial [Backusella circina FSU 941]